MISRKSLIAITQRVVHVPERNERRDALDQAWTRFLSDCALELLPVPNCIPDPADYVRRHGARGIVLTGGGNISSSMGRLDGAAGGVRSTKTDLAPERDVTETALLQASIESGWPVIGVCRMPDVDTAIDFAREVEGGCFHTASMYSRNIEKLSRMARIIDCSIFVKNGPHYNGLGLGGEGYTSFTIASPTGEGMTTARSFTRFRRCSLIDSFRIV